MVHPAVIVQLAPTSACTFRTALDPSWLWHILINPFPAVIARRDSSLWLPLHVFLTVSTAAEVNIRPSIAWGMPDCRRPIA